MTPPPCWTEDLRTGYGAIDNQHMAICEMLDALTGSLTPEDGERFAHALELHFAAHFDEEEALMTLHSYPLRRDHTTAHIMFYSGRFLPLLNTTKDSGYTRETIAALAGLVMTWFQEHILEADVKLARYVRELSST